MQRRSLLSGIAAMSGASGFPSPVSAASVNGPDVTCRLVTREMLDADPPAMRVTAIAWDSGFRDTGLQVGDQIIAVNRTPITRPDTPAQRAQRLQHGIGSLGEAQGWATAGLREQSPVTLTLRRRACPGIGWQVVSATGSLRPDRGWRDAANNPVMGPGGPKEMFENDGFPIGWRQWYENEFAPAVARNLDDPFYALAQTSRVELRQHQERGARVALLRAKYPGPFATAVQADYDTVLARLRGDRIELPPEALAWRHEEQERVRHVRDHARSAWDTALSSGQTMAPFPAIDPSRQDRRPLLGKRLVLGPLRNSDWISDTGRTWFAAGSPNQGFYFLDAEAPETQAALLALQRYRRLIAPDIDESYQFLVEIVDAARLGAVHGAAYFGLQVRLAAAFVGEAMFVDVSTADPMFAGEAAFATPRAASPAADAAPEMVMRAFIDTVKQGDLPAWRALFADWWIDRLPDGRPLLYPHAIRIQEDRFEQARRLMLGRVMDIRPVWTGEPRVVINGGTYPGALHIEEVDVELRHYGQFDNEVRGFSDVTVSGFWKLQRVDGGPWRIADQQVL